MREFHAKGVKFTPFDPPEKMITPVFQPKFTLASPMLKIPLNDVDSVDEHQ